MRTIVGLLAAMMALLVACSPPDSSANAPEESRPHAHRFELSLGERTIQVQVALTRQESARGLMEREHLEPDEGMLFVFERPRQASFWMKNTPLPLDIGYFSTEGELLEIHRLYPHDETSVRSNRADVHLALEMNQGWFRKNGIRPGARLDLDEVRDAIRRRGFVPADYGL